MAAARSVFLPSKIHETQSPPPPSPGVGDEAASAAAEPLLEIDLAKAGSFVGNERALF